MVKNRSLRSGDPCEDPRIGENRSNIGPAHAMFGYVQSMSGWPFAELLPKSGQMARMCEDSAKASPTKHSFRFTPALAARTASNGSEARARPIKHIRDNDIPHGEKPGGPRAQG